ncbi:Uncharacterized protein DBV15_11215 [Temnothorax longispinosus]|uniref:Uncharacterized protein n=1 Tax=Temnothorax longispinosus TaxID=300112 RepID=A0A4S2JLG0_9HYME|nr:Uncharacterized protein DBV15_11215 [Temnothorax longispinosus]
MPRCGAGCPGHSARRLCHPVPDSGVRQYRDIAAWRRSRAPDGARTMHLASPVQARPGEP